MSNHSVIKKLEEIEQLLRTQGVQVLNMDEAAKYLRVSKATLYRLTSSRKIVHHKPDGGKMVFFAKSDLDKYLLGVRIPTRAEAVKAAAKKAHV